VRKLYGVMKRMRGSFEVCLLIIFHTYRDFCVFLLSASALAPFSMHLPFQGVRCRSGGRIGERRRDPSKAFLSGASKFLVRKLLIAAVI